MGSEAHTGEMGAMVVLPDLVVSRLGVARLRELALGVVEVLGTKRRWTGGTELNK